MKFIIAFALLALFAVCALSCNPDDNNMPVCNTRNVNVPVRNFWDPTRYWVCASATGNAGDVQCPTATLFDSTTGQCVLWNKWNWIQPCPESNETTA